MTSLNKLGLVVVTITVVVLVVISAAWAGVRKLWLQEEVAPTSATSVIPELQQFGNLPSPDALPQTGPWTQKYLDSLPADTPADQIYAPERLTQFVEANKGTLLPTLPEGVVKTKTDSSPEAKKRYAEAISPATNPSLHTVTTAEIEAAWRSAYENSQPETINDLIQKLLENVKTLEAIEAPAGLKDLHTKIISASHALVNNVELMRDMNQDPVGGLIGARNIEDLTEVFQEIDRERKQLLEI